MLFIACKWIAINDLARWSSSAILFLHLSSRPRSTQDPRELPLKKGNNRAKIVNNYSLKWRWILMDIYRAAKRTEQAPSTRIRIFLNPQLFFSGYGYRPHVSGEIDSESGKKNPLPRVEKNISATNPITCGRVNPDIFLFDDVKSVSSLSPNNKPIWLHNVEGEQSKFPFTISLYVACSEEILV